MQFAAVLAQLEKRKGFAARALAGLFPATVTDMVLEYYRVVIELHYCGAFRCSHETIAVIDSDAYSISDDGISEVKPFCVLEKKCYWVTQGVVREHDLTTGRQRDWQHPRKAHGQPSLIKGDIFVFLGGASLGRMSPLHAGISCPQDLAISCPKLDFVDPFPDAAHMLVLHDKLCTHVFDPTKAQKGAFMFRLKPKIFAFRNAVYAAGGPWPGEIRVYRSGEWHFVCACLPRHDASVATTSKGCVLAGTAMLAGSAARTSNVELFDGMTCTPLPPTIYKYTRVRLRVFQSGLFLTGLTELKTGKVVVIERLCLTKLIWGLHGFHRSGKWSWCQANVRFLVLD